tara:strand:- start:2517 stop:2999 length:483 start_codon:yes stop_codon:yes gene_type:complete
VKKLILLLAILPLTACFDSDSGQPKSGVQNGTFKATVGDKHYELAIGCRDFDSSNNDTMISFYSDVDKSGNIDSDGDGILLHGNRIKIGKDKSPIAMDGISIVITDNGVIYENNIGATAILGTNKNWTVTANGITGSDEMYVGDEMDNKKLPISYEVICQ